MVISSDVTREGQPTRINAYILIPIINSQSSEPWTTDLKPPSLIEKKGLKKFITLKWMPQLRSLWLPPVGLTFAVIARWMLQRIRGPHGHAVRSTWAWQEKYNLLHPPVCRLYHKNYKECSSRTVLVLLWGLTQSPETFWSPLKNKFTLRKAIPRRPSESENIHRHSTRTKNRSSPNYLTSLLDLMSSKVNKGVAPSSHWSYPDEDVWFHIEILR